MNIQILDLIEWAKKATGITVIIDVFRAFSFECYAMYNNAKTILPVAKIDTAYQLKEENSNKWYIYIYSLEKDEGKWLRDLIMGIPHLK